MPHLASSGRTSFPADKDVPKALYRVVGYRVCGERAVRVDILERLADLIRPALAWRPGSPAQKPPGAIEGGGFTVTVNMTSLTGTSGEDFASVLRSLGYRMEKKPKPVEAPRRLRRQPLPRAAEAAPADAPAEAARRDAGCRGRGAETPVEAGDRAGRRGCAGTGRGAGRTERRDRGCAGDAGRGGVSLPSRRKRPPEPSRRDAKPAEEKPAEPEMIEVWRPGRPPEERRQRPPRPQGERREGEQRRPPRHRPAQPAAAAGRRAGCGSGVKRRRRLRPQAARRSPNGATIARVTDAAIGANAATSPSSAPAVRRRASAAAASVRIATGRIAVRAAKAGAAISRIADNEPREWIDPKERRGGQADPNSPFAKLAALKAQLEANKEGHS